MEKLTRPFALQMRALKSRGGGHLLVDMLIAAAVPMIISGVAREWSRLHPSVFNFLTNWMPNRRKPKFTRTIEYGKPVWSARGDEENATDEFHRNNILHKAILMYLGQEELGLRYANAQVLLSAVKETSTQDMRSQQHPPSLRGKKVYGGTSKQLKAYTVNIIPPQRDWVPLGDGVLFHQRTKLESDGSGNGGRSSTEKKTVIFTFASHASDGDVRIQAFINKAFLWYVKALKSTEDHSRYYYTPLTEGCVGEAQRQALMTAGPQGFGQLGPPPGPRGIQRYKRYRLGSEKAFDTLFFPEKELLLKILDNFQHKTGKYGIKGYPHKLGLLLHGPPGTGKSSLIKALALHTGRHVIDVPLARIRTNQELMDIMFDQSFCVGKQGVPVHHSIRHVIFVMEDVDASSPIVCSRDRPDKIRKPAQATNAHPNARKPAAHRGEGAATRAVAASMRKEIRPTITDSSSLEPVDANVTATAAATTTTSATTAVAADVTPTASPTPNQRDGVTTEQSPLVKVGEVPELPKVLVPESAEGDRGEGKGAEQDAFDTNNDDAEEKVEESQGQGRDAQPGHVLETALLQLSGEAAASRREQQAKEKDLSSMSDKLDLAGLLNVLDGVVDSPGRIVIMTTNYPEDLDAALIRPGRVDKKIHLGYMKYDAAKEMTRNFFEVEDLTVAQDERLRNIFYEGPPPRANGVDGRSEGSGETGRKIAPAVVEQLAGEFDTVDDFLVALEAI